MGSDVAVMDLRPKEESKMVGRSGPFRLRNPTTIEDMLERLNNVPSQ